MLQDIEANEAGRHIAQDLFSEALAADAALQIAERQHPVVLPAHHLAVECGPRRQTLGSRRQLGKPLQDQLLATRPEKRLPPAANHLSPNTVPFPLAEPVAKIAQRLRLRLQGMGQAKRIRPAELSCIRLLCQQRLVKLAGRMPFSHQAVGHGWGLDAGDFGKRPNHEALRNAHAEAAGDQLVEHQPLQRIELLPGGDEGGPLRLFGERAQRQDHLLDPAPQGPIGMGGGRGKQQRNRFGEIPHGVVAFVKQPGRNACQLLAPAGQVPRQHEPVQPPAAKKIDRPSAIGRSC